MNGKSDFLEQIVHQLYTYNYKIDGFNFYNYVDFIEEKHKRATVKGLIFYQNLIQAIPVIGERLADQTKGETPRHKEKIFRDTLSYCKQKIDEIENNLNNLPTQQIGTRNNNVVSLIHFDVCFAQQKLRRQVNEKQLKILLIRSNRKLFNADELVKYLSEISIKNTFVLKDIVKKSIKIIDINNNDFIELEKLERENPKNFGFSTPIGVGGFFSTTTPFECITIENKEINYSIDTETGYKDFFEQGNFEIFRSQDFAQKCGLLINLITAAFPDLKQEKKKTKNNEPIYFILETPGRKSEQAISALFKKLKEKNFVTGTAKQFKAIFSLNDFEKPVIWSSGQANELLYFYFKLEEYRLIIRPTTKYKILKNSFRKENDIPFNENFKQIYQGIKKDFNPPARAKEIDICFSSAFTFSK